MPGEHNRMNAAAAVAALELAGVAREDAERALAEFAGVDRRFQLVAERGGVAVYDDYGHNPTEIAATLRDRARACDSAQPRRRLPPARPRAHAPPPPRARRGARARGRRDRDRDRRRPRRAAAGRRREARPRQRSARRPPRLGADARRRRADRARLGAARATSSITLGVGEPWRVARAIAEGLPE